MSLSRAILIFLVISFIGQLIYYFPNLPDKIASHFNAQGQADFLIPKTSYLIFEGIILIIIILHFFFLPRWIKSFPDSKINLPNKDFWLSKEKRDETSAYIKNFFEWFFNGILGLFIAINELVFRANLANQTLSNSVWLILIVFLIYVAFLLIRLTLRFRQKK